MKKKILELLKPRFEGVSDTILERIASSLAKNVTSDEEAAQAVQDLTIEDLVIRFADSRVNEATRSAVRNYEEKHKLRNGKPIVEEGDGNGDETQSTEELPAWGKALKAQNDALLARIAKMDKANLITTRKERLVKVLKDAPKALKERYTKDFERLSFKDDADYDSWLGEITPTLEALATDLRRKGGTFSRPLGGGNGGDEDTISPELKARIDAHTNEKVASPIMGLPTK